nr:MAG TPA: hypothetical protein [Caudoviricetes sp.]
MTPSNQRMDSSSFLLRIKVFARFVSLVTW